jgi:hypothetical protein
LAKGSRWCSAADLKQVVSKPVSLIGIDLDTIRTLEILHYGIRALQFKRSDHGALQIGGSGKRGTVSPENRPLHR